MAKDDPMLWTEGYVIFNGATHEPMVFALTDPESGLNIQKAALIHKTYEGCRTLARNVFGAAAQDPNYPDRFPALSMRLEGRPNCAAGIAELKERLELEAFFDGTQLWHVRDMH